jgi:hypothetical protein
MRRKRQILRFTVYLNGEKQKEEKQTLTGKRKEEKQVTGSREGSFLSGRRSVLEPSTFSRLRVIYAEQPYRSLHSASFLGQNSSIEYGSTSSSIAQHILGALISLMREAKRCSLVNMSTCPKTALSSRHPLQLMLSFRAVTVPRW